MSEILNTREVHPLGEVETDEFPLPHRVQTLGGPVEVIWTEEAVTGHGPLAYFVDFLVKSGRWKRWVETCPLQYQSPNAPSKEEILATILVSVLSGHRRYAHISSLRNDQTLAGMLGVERLRSEDSVRRAFQKQDEEALTLWMDLNLGETFDTLLEGGGWVLDVDATVKTLFGRQEEARVGYNPAKPGRPSHVYHSLLFTAARLVMNVDVMAGNQTASLYGQDMLWGWLQARDRSCWPALVRGDCGHGNEQMMSGCEQRQLHYLFKLKASKGVTRLVEKLNGIRSSVEWKAVGQGWEAVEQPLQLQGWSRQRRVIVMRRKMEPVLEADRDSRQASLPGMSIEARPGAWYEYAALVTSWQEPDLLAIVQMYRDRGDAENQFDELKNQWGWRGYSTQDLKRSQLMTRIVALIYNWWSIYSRMATGRRHGEATTTRPMLQQGVARQTRHANQVRLLISSAHARAVKIAQLLARFSAWLDELVKGAEQLRPDQRWRRILRGIFQHFAGFPLDKQPAALAPAPSNCRI